MVSATSTLWTGSFSIVGVSGCFLLFLCFIVIPVFDANSVDPDQTPRHAASDLGLNCLPMFLLWDTRHEWVNRTRPHFCSFMCSLFTKPTFIHFV